MNLLDQLGGPKRTAQTLSWSDKDHWPSPYFSPDELKCKGTGLLMINREALELLDFARGEFGKPMFINSGYRSPSHNRNVGGAKKSYHLQGRAFDIMFGTTSEAVDLLACLLQAGFTGIGIYPNFIHVDDGPKRLWMGH